MYRHDSEILGEEVEKKKFLEKKKGGRRRRRKKELKCAWMMLSDLSLSMCL